MKDRYWMVMEAVDRLLEPPEPDLDRDHQEEPDPPRKRGMWEFDDWPSDEQMEHFKRGGR